MRSLTEFWKPAQNAHPQIIHSLALQGKEGVFNKEEVSIYLGFVLSHNLESMWLWRRWLFSAHKQHYAFLHNRSTNQEFVLEFRLKTECHTGSIGFRSTKSSQLEERLSPNLIEQESFLLFRNFGIRRALADLTS